MPRQYVNYSAEMLNVAVDLVKSKKISSYEAEKQFGIPRRTILNKCNDHHQKAVGHPTLLSAEEEILIADTVKVSAEFGSPLTLLDLRIVVYHHLENNGKSHIFHGKMPGERWARNFLRRHKMTQRITQNIKKSRASKSVAELNEYFKHLEVEIANVPPSNLLNYDETNLSDDPGCNKAIFKKGIKHPERVVNSSKSSVSIMFAGTADGKCLAPYVVYKAEHLWSRWCLDGPSGCRYNRTKSGWFDMVCFDDWFEQIILPWATGLDGPKVIIGDNLSSHISVSTVKLCREHNIRFVFLPRNATHLTQPLDLSLFGPMKKHWRTILLQYKLANQNAATINKCHFPQLLKQLIDKLQISNENNLKSGFKAAGIFPFNASKVTQNIPEETGQMRQKFDHTLLEYLKASRESKPMLGGRNQKLKITPGKSVSGEDAIISQKPTETKGKPTEKVCEINNLDNKNECMENINENEIQLSFTPPSPKP
ncbi:uncharacterized protein LOC128198204 [Bicyclus anynana]|uniref:Uncharacterized protein LOC128198204 n=1 Tax=Bicyclus anynana TaxID=110368 RepID=A0ABM3LGQ4_BICAN|nr:uncharacterized protein LOC128198204 [Bicyclus anynana]